MVWLGLGFVSPITHQVAKAVWLATSSAGDSFGKGTSPSSLRWVENPLPCVYRIAHACFFEVKEGKEEEEGREWGGVQEKVVGRMGG